MSSVRKCLFAEFFRHVQFQKVSSHVSIACEAIEIEAIEIAAVRHFPIG